MAARLIELLEERAGEDAIGFSLVSGIDEVTTETLSFRSLHARAVFLAPLLRERAGDGERVMLLYTQELEFICALFACWYAHLIPVPLQTPHATRTPLQVQAIAGDCGATLLLTSRAVLDRVSVTDLSSAHPNLTCLVTDALEIEHDPGPLARLRETRDEIAFIQYTSGSTGSPKGVMVGHGNLMHNLAAIQRTFGTTPTTSGVLWLPFFHDMGLIGGVLQAVFCGGHLVIVPAVTFAHTPAVWLDAISRYRAEIAGGPDSAYAYCVDRITPDQKKRMDLGSWRVAFNGAEPIRSSTLDGFAAAFAPCGFRREAFLGCYGLAEATLLVAAGAPEIVEPDDAPEHAARAFVSSGTVRSGVDVRVVDPDCGCAVGDGHIGEIWLRGPNVAMGYWGRPAETAATFAAFIGDDGPYLRTGDLGFVQDGQLTIAGRLKDVIVVNGRNYDQDDIERMVRECDPLLKAGAGAAFAPEDGSSSIVVVHEVVRNASGDYRSMLREIRRRLGERYDVTIKDIVLVRKGTLPRTSSGKVQRLACRERFRESRLAIVAQSGRAPAAQAEESAAGE